MISDPNVQSSYYNIFGYIACNKLLTSRRLGEDDWEENKMKVQGKIGERKRWTSGIVIEMSDILCSNLLCQKN